MYMYMYSFILSSSSPVYQVEMLCFALICICDLAQPAELRAQRVRASVYNTEGRGLESHPR